MDLETVKRRKMTKEESKTHQSVCMVLIVTLYCLHKSQVYHFSDLKVTVSPWVAKHLNEIIRWFSGLPDRTRYNT